MKLFNLLFLVLLTSCTAQKVAVHVEVFKPYCGGAKPTPEMARGERTPYSNQKIAVFRRSIDKDSAPILVKWIDLDSLGKWIGPLKPGTYDLYRSDKILSIEEIEQKYRKQDNEIYAFVGEEKLRIWKSTPDFTMEVKEKSTVKIELTEKCFVGLNPCMEYIGPKPR